MKIPMLIAVLVYLMLFVTVKAFADEQFALIDVDNNGTISLQEAKLNYSLYREFTDLDKNGNGELCELEFSRFTG